jgi:hypothetical protein
MDDPLLDVIAATVPVLDSVGVPYAITGSVASSVHGEPCVSADVDLVVRMTPQQAERVARDLPERFYRSVDALCDAATNCSIANLVDTVTGLKVDLSVLSATSFHQRVFERREAIALGPNAPAFQFVSPEDIVLMKLVWRKDSRSQKQWENALGVVRVQGARLDWSYLFGQAVQLGVIEDLKVLRDEAGV